MGFSTRDIHRESAGVRLSVVVPAHQAGTKLNRCIGALTASLSPRDELIVVFDGTEGDVGSLPTLTLRLEENRGPGAARNAGANAATGDVLLFIDSDVEVLSDTLLLVRDAFTADPDLAALIGSYDDAPADRTTLSRYRNLLHHYTHQHSSRNAHTFWGACGAIRRQVFKAIGGFDERYAVPSVEDIELGYRLTMAGHRIELRREIQVKHLKNWGVLDVLRTDVFRRAAPWTRLILEHRGLVADLNLQHNHRLSVVCAFVLLLCGVGTILEPALSGGIVIGVGTLIVLNWSFYRFLRGRMSLFEAVQSFFWHWIFYLSAGLGAMLGVVQYMLKRERIQASARPGFAIQTRG